MGSVSRVSLVYQYSVLHTNKQGAASYPVRVNFLRVGRNFFLCAAEQNKTTTPLRQQLFLLISGNRYECEGGRRSFTPCLWNETTDFDVRPKLMHTEQKSNKMIPEAAFFSVSPPHRRDAGAQRRPAFIA